MFAFAAGYGGYDLGARQWPPKATLDDGSRAPLQEATVETCFQARTLGLFGDRRAEARWTSCGDYLERFQALGAFVLRYYSVVGSLGIGIFALLAFALSVRFGETAPKILRRPRLFTGRRALMAFVKAARDECRTLGQGSEFVPGIPLSRDRESRHFLARSGRWRSSSSGAV